MGWGRHNGRPLVSSAHLFCGVHLTCDSNEVLEGPGLGLLSRASANGILPILFEERAVLALGQCRETSTYL